MTRDHTVLERYQMNILARSFLYGVLSGMTAIGYLYPQKLTPRRYPYGADQDLRAVAGDLWKAVRSVNEETEKAKAA